MFDINGSTIRLTRGDTLYLKITLSKDGEAFTPDDSDTIRFAMKQSFSDVGWLLMRNSSFFWRNYTGNQTGRYKEIIFWNI